MGPSAVGGSVECGICSAICEYWARRSGSAVGKSLGAEGNWVRIDPASEPASVVVVDALLVLPLRVDLERLRPKEDASTLRDEETLPLAVRICDVSRVIRERMKKIRDEMLTFRFPSPKFRRLRSFARKTRQRTLT